MGLFVVGSGDMKEGQSLANFPDTRWTLVQQVGAEASEDQERALEELCAIYWPPVYAFVRSKGHPPAEAEDLTQGFFRQLLAREDFETTSQEKGKLRTFLLCSMQNFLRNDWRHRNRLKRGGGAETLPLLDEAEDHYSAELADHMTPEQIFERHWVVTLLEQVVGQLEAKYQAEEKGRLFAEVKPYIVPSTEPAPRREAAARLGMPETHFNVAVHRLRKQYRKMLREEIADTLHEDISVDEELRHLFGAMVG